MATTASEKLAPKNKTAGSTYGTKTLAQALAAFQSELPAVSLDATNPHFKSKFTTLANLSKTILPKLAEHGFAFSVGSFVDNGLLVVDAHLIHESGESRSAQFPITETNPQKVGSAVTYFRRYALAALTGVVADEDDDGNAASTQSQAGRALDNARTPKIANKPAAKASAKGGATAELKAKIGALVTSGKATSDRANALVKEKSKELSADPDSPEVFSAVLAALEAEIEGA